MSNGLYDNARALFATAGINFGSDTIKVYLCPATYTVNLSTHVYLTDMTGACTPVAGHVTLGTKTTTAGACGAANSTFSAVSGAQVTSIVIYKDTGTAGTSPLIAYIDTATGLPITPNGGDIIVAWDTGTNKIFRL